MKEIYLDSFLKEKYQLDFTNNVVECDNDFWKLDSDLGEILIKINQNNHVQTLYSKKCNGRNSDLSYLQICYSKVIELHLLRSVIPRLTEINLRDNAAFYYEFSFPTDNVNYRENSESINMGCICDKDYFKINHLRLYLKSKYKSEHDSFWKELTDQLINISPE